MIERISKMYGPPIRKWYGGDLAWHAVWSAFAVRIDDDGIVSLELFNVTPEQVDAILAEAVI